MQYLILIQKPAVSDRQLKFILPLIQKTRKIKKTKKKNYKLKLFMSISIDGPIVELI